MTKTLVSLAKEASKALEDYNFIRVISHNDTDGLSAAGIMSTALLRANTVFHTSIVSSLDQGVIEMVNAQVYGKDGAVVFCDMGSGQPELLDKVKDDVIIIDHHQVVGDHNGCVHVNPHLSGIDGSSLISASGMAFLVVRGMGSNNDLAGLALTGAVGDKQRMDGPNSEILKEAVKTGVISVKTGLKVPDGPVEDVLLTLTEPYLDTAGDKADTEAFLSELGISGPIQEMGLEDLSMLSSAMALKTAGKADPTIVRSMVGDVLILEKEVVPNIYTLEWMLNCCGKVNRSDLGLSLCLRDVSVVDEALALSAKYQKSIVENIREAVPMIREMENIRYVALEDNAGTGIIAGTLIRYVCPDKPFLTLNKVDKLVKVSARGTPKMVDNGLDLAVAMREAARAAGGQGGGHNIASGAGIPVGSEESFLAAVDRIVGGQLS